MSSARYKLMRDLVRLRLYYEASSVEPMEIALNPNATYFVDILETEPKTRQVKMKIYMTDGNTITGWQTSNWLEIHYFEDQFDGRYNLRPEDR